MPEISPNVVNNSKKHEPWYKFALKGLLIVGIFYLGIAIGNGTITVGPDAIFRKSVQQSAPKNLDYSSVEQVYDALRKNYDGQLDVNKLLDGLKSGLVQASGDPYTEYFNAKDASKFNEQLSGSFTGIGAELGKDADGNLIVVAPISGFPAEKAGLKSKDIIAEIDGKSTANLSVDQAVSKIRGPKDTKVTLKIIRNKSQAISITITRADIKIPSVTWKILDGNVGYMRISIFSNDTTDLAKKAAQEFKQKNVKGIILDMRGDPGGLLDSAVGVSNLWLSNGKTILTERRSGTIVKTYTASDGEILGKIPTVVLIDGGSASASEITAGALKDNGVATLLGVKSFGKGSVQTIEQLPGGAEVKITIARWYTPGGKNIDKQGIEPDKTVKISDTDIKNGKDPQLDAATNLLLKN